jgi:hypothetical protein
VRQQNALLERGTQDRLVFVDLDFDADWLEPDDVLPVGHNPFARPSR